MAPPETGGESEKRDGRHEYKRTRPPRRHTSIVRPPSALRKSLGLLRPFARRLPQEMGSCAVTSGACFGKTMYRRRSREGESAAADDPHAATGWLRRRLDRRSAFARIPLLPLRCPRGGL